MYKRLTAAKEEEFRRALAAEGCSGRLRGLVGATASLRVESPFSLRCGVRDQAAARALAAARVAATKLAAVEDRHVPSRAIASFRPAFVCDRLFVPIPPRERVFSSLFSLSLFALLRHPSHDARAVQSSSS